MTLPPKDMMPGLYIHIPFCTQICPYCAFAKTEHAPEKEARFLSALEQEIKALAAHLGRQAFRTVFFGGGTPSSLKPESILKIGQLINTYFDLSGCLEFTAEMNPESTTTPVLEAYTKIGLNRVSLGIQSFNSEELAFLGRGHTQNKIETAIAMLKAKGIKNFNLDLIFGAPIGSVSVLKHSLELALSFQPTHLSTYGLSIEPGTRFSQQGIKPVSNDTEADMYTMIQERLQVEGWHHYEVSAFSKPGYESKHNLIYWQYQDFIGIGPSANTFFKNIRYTGSKNWEAYTQNPIPAWIDNNAPFQTSIKDQITEFTLSNLRMMDGFSLSQFEDRFGISFEKAFAYTIHPLLRDQFITIKEDTCKLLPKGLFLLNDIAESFLEPTTP